MAEDHRLDRIEQKLDKLAEAVSAIARVEEKIYASTKRIDRLEFRLDEQENDLDSIKTIVTQNSQGVKNSERFLWAIITATISTIAYMFR
jgi:uncharacterized coiled-coil protein SlyX